jgi:hypothetical protein
VTVYKRCPLCDALFEIGPEDDGPMRRHLRTAHGDDAVGGRRGPGEVTPASLSAYSFEDVRLGIRESDDEESPRGLLVALLYKRDVLVPVLAQWYGVPETTVRAQFERLETALFDGEEEPSFS